MKMKRFYSASLERLPEGFYQWEQDWKNPDRQGNWRDFLAPGDNPDWLKRSNVFMDDSNPPKECYVPKQPYTRTDFLDISIGDQKYRFSEEGEFPYREFDGTDLVTILRNTLEQNLGKNKVAFCLETEE